MTAENVHWFLDLFDEFEITVWIDGGWGVDALLGECTRPHEDLDIILPVADSAKLTEALFERGFCDVPTDDRCDRNFVMGHASHGLIDFHLIHLTDDGGAVYGPGEVDWVISASELRCEGSIGGRSVRCLTAEYQVRSHTGYTLKETDFADMNALQQRLGVALLEEQRRWNPQTSAVIICDMWDTHHCRSAAERLVEMAPHMNEVIAVLRENGALIVHAPSGCMAFYDGTPQRQRALEAPHADAAIEFKWNEWNPDRESPLPSALVDPGPCSCHDSEPCCRESHNPWVRQIEMIEIAGDDAISDDGQEIHNLLEERGIEDVIVMGVHTNLCVLGRPFGIRQLVYLGKKPILCRDLTDSFHKDPRGHFHGTDLIIEHIERHWCPTVTSDQLVGSRPGFSDDEH